MPHFVIDCSEDVLQMKSADAIMHAVYEEADSTGLFAKNDIKVRVRTFQHYKLGQDKQDFLHIFGNIMEGRTTEQKADLSRRIVHRLNQMLPGLSILSMNVKEFELATYCNKAMLDPANLAKHRHYAG